MSTPKALAAVPNAIAGERLPSTNVWQERLQQSEEQLQAKLYISLVPVPVHRIDMFRSYGRARRIYSRGAYGFMCNARSRTRIENRSLEDVNHFHPKRERESLIQANVRKMKPSNRSNEGPKS